MFADSDFLPISALQHFNFCKRQFALIHIERIWSENRLTAEGRVLHENTDILSEHEVDGMHIARAVPLKSERLGIFGVADTVEFFSDGTPFPVEYKHGKPNAHGSDEIQLCAQALCLEEMTKKPVLSGALFYGKTRRRENVDIDEELRRKTISVAEAARALRERGETPPAIFRIEACDKCSLKELCLPECGENSDALERDWQNRLNENKK